MVEQQKTGRSWWFKLGVGVVVVILLGVGTVLFLGWSADRGWQNYSARLRAEGEPLTFVEIEALRTTVPNDQNGALVVEGLFDELEAVASAKPAKSVFALGSSNRGGYSVAARADFFGGIPHVAIQASREFLEQHQSLRDELMRLGDFSDGRFDLAYQSIPIATRLPHVGPLRRASKFVSLDAALALIDGQFSRAAEDIQIQLRLAALLNEEPIVISRLVQVYIDATAIKSLESTLRVGELPESTLAILESEFASHLSSATMRWALWGERASFAETCDQVALGNIDPAGFQTFPSTSSSMILQLGWLPTMVLRMNQGRGTQILSELVAAGDDPRAMIEAGKKLNVDVTALSPIFYPVVRILIPSLQRAMTLHVKSTAHLHCALAAVAAERFRLNTGRLPNSPNELVPDYIDEWPTDPFDGQPMRFAVTDDGIVIYSMDENAIDDGGSVAPVEGETRPRDVGFRLFRLDRRGLLIIEDNTNPNE